MENYITPNVYSLDEQVIGTWIDGKPIYRRTKIFTGGLLPADGTFDVDDINEISQIIYSEVLTDASSDNDSQECEKVLLTFGMTYQVFTVASEGKLHFNCLNTNDFSGKNMTDYDKVTLILEYTKTTD